MRLPVIVFNRELNPDESQMLSHAITLFQDPVYWRSVDGTTIGPLDNYLLVIPKLVGFPDRLHLRQVYGTYLCRRCVAFSVFHIKKLVWEQLLPGQHLLVPLIFLAFTQEIDFVHYSSEQLPVFLLALCLWLLSRMTASMRNHYTGNACVAWIDGRYHSLCQTAGRSAGMRTGRGGALVLLLILVEVRKDFKPLILLDARRA